MYPAPILILPGLDPNADELLLVAEGYTPSSMSRFVKRCQRFVTAVTAAPWFTPGLLKIWRLDADSTGGAFELAFAPGCRPSAVPRTVSFGAVFGGLSGCSELSGNDELVTGLVFGNQLPAESELGIVKQYVVFVDSLKRGGSAGGEVAWISGGLEWVVGAALHEFGHLYDLHDEYENKCGEASSDDALVIRQNNVCSDAADPPWSRQLSGPGGLTKPKKLDGCTDCDEAVPNPFQDTWIGVYEGAKNRHTDVYRPSQKCRMRKSADEFCPVCTRILAYKLNPVGLSPVD